MRFHHSTRRGRNRLSAAHGFSGSSSASSNARARKLRWSQLSYCRQSNIHFNRRMPIDPPATMDSAASVERQQQHQSTGDDRYASGGLQLGAAVQQLIQTQEQLVSKNSSIARCNCAPNHFATDPDRELSARLNGLCLQCNVSLTAEAVAAAAASDTDIVPTEQVANQQELRLTRTAPTDDICYCQFCNPTTSQQQQQQDTGANQQSQPQTGNSQPEASPPSSATTTTTDDSSTVTMVASNVAFANLPAQQLAGDSATAKQCCRNLQKPIQFDKRQLDRNHNNNNNNNNNNNDIQLNNNDNKDRLDATDDKQIASPVGGQQMCGKTARASSMDLASARERLLAQVEKKPFWSNKAARRMQLSVPEERRVYLYELISFCERRELEWRFEPYSGRLTHGSTPFRRLPMGSIVVPPSTQTQAQVQVQVQSQAHAQSQAQAVASGSTLSSSPALASGNSPTKSPITGDDDDDNNYFRYSPKHSTFAANNHQQTTFNYNQSPSRTSTPATTAMLASPISQSSNKSIIIDPNKLSTGQQLLQVATAPAAATEQGAMPSAELVWSIEAPAKSRPHDFVGSIYTCEVPETSFVKRCHGCAGKGRLKCNSCYGVGYEVCISCSGRGTTRSWLSRSAAARYAGSSTGAGASGGGVTGGGGISGGRSSRAPTSMDPKESHDHGETGNRKMRVRAEQKTGGGITASHASPWQTESCTYCHGAGQKRCWTCAGRAYLTCTGCAGTGQVRCYLQLSITWLNHHDELLLNNNDSILPRDRLRLASGFLLIDEIGSPRLSPLNDKDVLSKLELLPTDGAAGSAAPEAAGTQLYHRDKKTTASYNYNYNYNSIDVVGPTTTTNKSSHQRNSKNDPLQQVAAIQAASGRLIDKHKSNFKGERFIKQRQKLTQIECFIVRYDWKRRQGHFVIYGNERKVYIAKYPFKSICNIT